MNEVRFLQPRNYIYLGGDARGALYTLLLEDSEGHVTLVEKDVANGKCDSASHSWDGPVSEFKKLFRRHD